MKVFLFMAIFSCFISYLNIDPIKSRFFLIFSLLFSIPLVSFSLHTWFSYFICLLFLSGIFVIIVYFARLSKINVVKSRASFLVLGLTFFFARPHVLDYFRGLGLSSFYYRIYWYIFFYILLCLVFFMNFSSYFLNFSGALRKI